MKRIIVKVVFVSFFKRCFWLALLVCIGCSAQSSSPEINKRVEREVRNYFNLPKSVQITIGSPKSSEFPNYDIVPITFENAGRKTTQDFLLAKDGKTLIRFARIDVSPTAYEASLKKDADEKQKQLELMKKIDVTGRPFRGAKDAKVVVVVYDDFECPYCAQMYRNLFDNVMKDYGDRVRVVFKDYPLFQIHPWAKRAALDSNCLAEQDSEAFWDFSDYVHADQRAISGTEKDLKAAESRLDTAAIDAGKRHNVDGTILQACLKAQPDAALKASIKEAESFGVEATPTLFVNGERLDGVIEPDEMRRVLERALRESQRAPAIAGSAPAAATPASPRN